MSRSYSYSRLFLESSERSSPAAHEGDIVSAYASSHKTARMHPKPMIGASCTIKCLVVPPRPHVPPSRRDAAIWRDAAVRRPVRSTGGEMVDDLVSADYFGVRDAIACHSDATGCAADDGVRDESKT